MQSLYKRNLLPLEHSVAKIKRNFTLGVCGGGGNVSSVNGSGLNDVTNNINSKCVRISLKCPIIKSRIRLPARGLECKHVQCFDLEGYLMMNCERGTWRCPECSKPALTESLEIDQYYWAILNTLTNADVDEVIIDSSANWRAVQINNNNSNSNILLSPSANGNNNNSLTTNNPNSNNSNSSGPVRPTNSAISNNNNANNTLDVAGAGNGVVPVNTNATNNNSVTGGTGSAALGSLKKENNFSDDITKVMSPGSTQLPTWDSTQSMSPFSSHDMNSIANGNLMSGTSNNITNSNNQL